MTLINADTAEVIAHCTPEEARWLTDEIRGAAERIWTLLLEAHDRQAWAALGYSSWRDYAQTEFGMSQSRAYQLLDQGRVVRAIEEATGSTDVELTEAAARDIKPGLTDVTNAIKNRLADAAPAPDPEAVQQIVNDVVAEAREKKQQDDEDRAALADLKAAAEQAGVDQDEDRMTQRGAFSRLCRDLTRLPNPDEFCDYQAGFLTPRHISQAERAYEWLDGFLLNVKESE